MPHQLITSFVWTRKVTKQLPSLLATSKLDYMDPLKLQMAAGLSSPMSPLDYTSLTSFPGFANNLSGLSTAAFPSNMGHLSSDMQWGAGASQVCLTCGVADVQWVTCMRSRGKPGVCVTCSMGGMQWEQGQAKWVLVVADVSEVVAGLWCEQGRVTKVEDLWELYGVGLECLSLGALAELAGQDARQCA
eukprot:scaffold231185_cov23-Tisochrysis_lutea.AAC.1